MSKPAIKPETQPEPPGWHRVEDRMPPPDVWVAVVLEDGEEMKGMWLLHWRLWGLEDGTTTRRVSHWRHL